MDNFVQIILAIISSSAVTSFFTLRSRRRTGDTQSYQLLLDDLNKRMSAALDRMRKLEQELVRINDENKSLVKENEMLKDEIATLRNQLKQ